MEGRSAGQCVRGIQDIRDEALILRKRLAIIGLDFSKVFDSVSHSYIFQVLQAMNFPETFISILKTLLSNPQIILEVNEMKTDVFQMEDGCGQGDPISAFLFILAVEPLLIVLANSNSIPRFKIEDQQPGEEAVESDPESFADDIHICLDGGKPGQLKNVLACKQVL